MQTAFFTQITAYLHELNTVSIFVRLFLSVVFGAILGMDRARKNRAAGFRTHMLVCMGAALVMLTGQYIALEFHTADVARLGAQVISGIGFLGAGTIVVTRANHVTGLTTAAGLWASACIGLALGIGFYSGAIIAEFFVVLIVVFMHRVDVKLHSRSRVMEIYCEFENNSVLSAVIACVHESSVEIAHMEIVRANDPAGSIAAIITLKLPTLIEHEALLATLRRLDGLVFIDEV